MLSELELEGISILAEELKSLKKKFAESREGAELLWSMERRLASYVEPLLEHIAELEKQIEDIENSGWDKSEMK